MSSDLRDLLEAMLMWGNEMNGAREAGRALGDAQREGREEKREGRKEGVMDTV